MSQTTGGETIERYEDETSALGQRLLAWADRNRWWLFVFTGLLLLVGFNGMWRIGADSSIYIEVARNIYEGKGYCHIGGYHRSISPGLSYIIAMAMYFGGGDCLWPAHVLMLLIAVLVLFLNYRLFYLYAGRPVAVVITFLLCCNETFYRYAYQLLPDIPFLAGLLLFLLGYEHISKSSVQSRRCKGLTLIIIGLFVMAIFRSVVVVVLAALFLVFLLRLIQSPHRIRYGVLLALVLVSLLVAHLLTSPVTTPTDLTRDEKIIQQKLISELPTTLHEMVIVNLPKLITEIAAEAALGLDYGPIPATPVSLIVLGCGIAVIRRHLLWGMLIITFIFQWLLFLVTERYFLAILPLLIFACWLAADGFTRRYRRASLDWLFIGIAVFWIGSNLVRISDFVIEQHRNPFYAYYEDGRYQELVELGEYIRLNLDENALVIYSSRKNVNILSYLGNRQVKHNRKFRSSDFNREHIYIVGSNIDKRLRRAISRRSLVLGESVFTTDVSEYKDHNQHRLSLHRLTMKEENSP